MFTTSHQNVWNSFYKTTYPFFPVLRDYKNYKKGDTNCHNGINLWNIVLSVVLCSYDYGSHCWLPCDGWRKVIKVRGGVDSQESDKKDAAEHWDFSSRDYFHYSSATFYIFILTGRGHYNYYISLNIIFLHQLLLP